MAQNVDEALKKLQGYKGIVGTIVVNNEGIPVKTNIDNTLSVQYSAFMWQLVEKARSAVRDLDPTNDLCFIRMRTTVHEILVASEKEYILIVLQNPSD